MADYKITFARSARKELQILPANLVARIVPRIDALAKSPRPAGCRKLAGEENLWRIRIGDYRIVYSIYDSDRVVDIARVRHRSKAYD
jgi:mRNA interferase RelE/StbE